MKRAKPGSRVSIHYVGTLDNGRIFDSTTDRAPLTFTIGRNEVFPKLEQAVLSMRTGEVKNLVIPAHQAYGARLEANFIRIERSQFPAHRQISLGQKLSIDFKGGISRVMLVTEVTEHEVVLDGNHPLAGQDLTFALQLVAVSAGEAPGFAAPTT